MHEKERKELGKGQETRKEGRGAIGDKVRVG